MARSCMSCTVSSLQDRKPDEELQKVWLCQGWAVTQEGKSEIPADVLGVRVALWGQLAQKVRRELGFTSLDLQGELEELVGNNTAVLPSEEHCENKLLTAMKCFEDAMVENRHLQEPDSLLPFQATPDNINIILLGKAGVLAPESNSSSR
ncbi:hypothetical protein DUI87_10001 [Hirundo rustica rustica]|uniref:Uncharacterized protein n=1 Tax=Hirundo rustica rustica TaxID=333673 RepID=A0A3M0KH52_HIRRU|nr:hypothetical protein DUI87_10001 [Hirundo rustica rustica]